MQGIVRRMGLMAYRIMMVLTAVRTFETEMFKLPHAPDGSVHLFCQEEDFHTAMSICDTLLAHSVFIYRKLMRAQRRSVPDQQEKVWLQGVTLSSSYCPTHLPKRTTMLLLKHKTRIEAQLQSG